MADRYWVGGTGDWSDTSHWSTSSGGAGGASVPTGSDNVFFDANSDSGTTFSVSIVSTNRFCRDFTASGLNYEMTFTQSLQRTVNIFGNLSLPATNFVWQGPTLLFNSSSQTITTNGVVLNDVIIEGTGSAAGLLDPLSCDVLNMRTSFNTNNHNINCSEDFVSLTSNSRTINLGSSTVTTPKVRMGLGSLILNPGTSTINLDATNSSFEGGGEVYYIVEFTNANPTTDVKTITGVNRFHKLTATINGPGINVISLSDNQTIEESNASGSLVSGRLTLTGLNGSGRIFLKSNTLGTQRTITFDNGLETISDTDFRDIISLGNTLSGTRLGNCGNNLFITFTAAANKYWVGASSADWNSTSWATSSGGAAADNNFPLPQDTAIIDDSALSASQTVTLNAAYNYPTIDTSARTNAMTLSLSQNSTIVGGLLVGSGVTISGDYFVFTNKSLQQLSGSLPRLYIDGFSSGGVELAAAVSATSRVDLVNGTLDLNGYTLTTPTFETLAGTKNITFNGGTIDITGSSTSAWVNSNPTNFTTTAGSGTGTISMTSASAKTFTGGGSTYNCTLNQGGAGALTITGINTFGDITNTHAGSSTISLGASQTVSNFTLSGTSGNVITFNSSSAGVQRNISKSSGTVSVSYLNIVDSNGTGGATWLAFTANGNVNGGNNLGWIFVPPTSGSNMFMMF